ncbi:MAG TPA: ribonuclease III [Candidatus Acidoferrales bacterium]|nr:ribonuclease III [Candidatus Acidoferrales bacterium]
MNDEERHELEQKLGHRFQQIAWLERALTHRSRTFASDTPHNERLEFIGDSVLGLAVSRVLVVRFAEWDEGQLSKARARLVNASCAREAASRLGLGEHLRLGPGEEKTGGRNKPNLLANVYEAVVGAIFRDAGFEAAAAFVDRSLLSHTALAEDQLAESDHKSMLQEWLQSRGMGLADYRVIRESGPEHQKTFRVAVRVNGRQLGECEGRSKKAAEQAAAKEALEMLRSSEAGAAGVSQHG